MNFIPHNLLSSSINSSEYRQDEIGYRPPPKPSLNGGLYTGEEFESDGLHRNFPVKADSVNYHINNLKSANPPPGVLYQFPDSIRPGNNLPNTSAIGLHKYSDRHSIMCTRKPEYTNCSYTNKARCNDHCSSQDSNKGFSKHSYLP